MQRQVLVSLLWNKHRRDVWYVADSYSFEVVFEETLKDHEMIIQEECKRPESDTEASPRSMIGVNVVAMSGMLRIQTLLQSSFNYISQSGRIIYQVISREFNETRSRNAYLIPSQKSNKHTLHKAPICNPTLF